MSFTIHACWSTIRFSGTTVTDIAVSRGDTVPKGSSRSCSASDCGTEAKPPSGTGTPTLISGKAAAAGRDREHRGAIASPFLSLRGSCERKATRRILTAIFPWTCRKTKNTVFPSFAPI
ncbi:hypothetical protein [Burkholderia gladioli]|uniref:hypothetical protein n=1 Tax=Burkholderia gladioli TaxID=28095 RepID=UPI0011D1B366|nr:hypothetical protein [Burkholderia gladioli]MBW5284245.1 hypothetical protein [Burkholderia gladioli]